MATSMDAKLLKGTRFPPEFNQKVDMQLVNFPVMKKWIAGKMSETLGREDDVVIELCFGLLEGSRFPDIKALQIQLTGFLEKDTPAFCKELWKLFLSAQSSPQGVPKELLEAKKLELIQEKLEADRVAAEARQKQAEAESRQRESFEAGVRGRGQGRIASWRGRRPGNRMDRREDIPTSRNDMRRSRSPSGIANDIRVASRSRSQSRSRTRSQSHSRSRSRAGRHGLAAAVRRRRSPEQSTRRRSLSPYSRHSYRAETSGRFDGSSRRHGRSRSPERGSPHHKRRRQDSAPRGTSRDRPRHYSRERSRLRSPVSSRSHSRNRGHRAGRKKVRRRRRQGHRNISRNRSRSISRDDDRRRTLRSRSSSRLRYHQDDRYRRTSPIRSKRDRSLESDRSLRIKSAGERGGEGRSRDARNQQRSRDGNERASDSTASSKTQSPPESSSLLKEKLLREKILQMRSTNKGD